MKKKIWIWIITLIIYLIWYLLLITNWHLINEYNIATWQYWCLLTITWLILLPCIWWWHDFFTDLFANKQKYSFNFTTDDKIIHENIVKAVDKAIEENGYVKTINED